jgi:Tol biopolymer transport system component
MGSKLAIVDLDAQSGTNPHPINPDPRINSSLLAGGPKFSPDGKNIVYSIVDQGAWNLWMQPLDATPGHSITTFASERIGDFRWSPDGKALAVTREVDTSDVVLLRQSSQ